MMCIIKAALHNEIISIIPHFTDVCNNIARIYDRYYLDDYFIDIFDKKIYNKYK